MLSRVMCLGTRYEPIFLHFDRRKIIKGGRPALGDEFHPITPDDDIVG